MQSTWVLGKSTAAMPAGIKHRVEVPRGNAAECSVRPTVVRDGIRLEA